MICATLVNTDPQTDKQLLTAVILLVQLSELKREKQYMYHAVQPYLLWQFRIIESPVTHPLAARLKTFLFAAA